MERDQILELLRERIVAFAASRYRREPAEDVAQEVLRILHEKYSHVTDLTELLPLSLKIARFRIMSGVRTEIRRGEHNALPVDDLPLPDLRLNPAEQAERNQRLSRLKAALQTLGERCRRLIRYKLEGKSFPEIQALFEVSSINTIYTWDYRCRKQLLEAFGGSWEARR
ncbi:MAG: sigma-70 family RNA polymerase sigma factor [Bryobacterales bacterium]|nr:sigma-70 family RNA polymerase sigma factor [Bryobacterales bacterium]